MNSVSMKLLKYLSTNLLDDYFVSDLSVIVSC